MIVTPPPAPQGIPLETLLSRSWALFKRNWIVALPPVIAMVVVLAGVAVIFAATRGYLDAIPTDRVGDWEKRFIAYVHEKHAGVTDAIRESNALPGDTEKQLIAAIEDFNKGF